MTRLRNNKKGFGFGEAIMLLIALFLFGILAVVTYNIFGELNDDLQADPDLSVTAKAKVDDLHNRFPSTFDGAFVTILGLLFIVGIVASLLVDSHPAFLIVILILMAFIALAAGFLSNSWGEFMDDTEMTGFSTSFPMTNWVLDNLLIVIAVITVSFGGIIYFKQRI